MKAEIKLSSGLERSDSQNFDSRLGRLARRASHIRRRNMKAEAKLSSGLERSDSQNFDSRLGRLARRASHIRRRNMKAEAKLSSGLERSDINKRKGHPATRRPFLFKGE